MVEHLTQMALSSPVSETVHHNWTNITFSSETADDNRSMVPHTEIVRMMEAISRPPIIVLGTIGNLLTFFAMRRGSLKEVSTCFYMAILGLADTGVLWTGGFSVWMENLTYRKINPDTWTDCKMMLPLFFFCTQYSASLLIIMSAEKCFALYFPLQSKSICTVRTAKKISAVAAFLFFMFDVHIIFTRDEETDSNGVNTCIFVKDPQPYFQTDALLASFIPWTVMFTANCFIILKFMIAKWKDRHGGTESVNQALSKSAVRGSVMLLTVSFSFIILTAPINIAFSITKDPPRLFYGVTVILQYLNHSINGVLYCITGSRFRQELMDLFKCCSKKRPVISSVTNTNTSHVSSRVTSG